MEDQIRCATILQSAWRLRCSKTLVRRLHSSLKQDLLARTLVWEWEKSAEDGPELAHRNALAVLEVAKRVEGLSREEAKETISTFISGLRVILSLPFPPLF